MLERYMNACVAPWSNTRRSGVTQRVIVVRKIGGQCEGGCQGEITSAGENRYGCQWGGPGGTDIHAADLPEGQSDRGGAARRKQYRLDLKESWGWEGGTRGNGESCCTFTKRSV